MTIVLAIHGACRLPPRSKSWLKDPNGPEVSVGERRKKTAKSKAKQGTWVSGSVPRRGSCCSARLDARTCAQTHRHAPADFRCPEWMYPLVISHSYSKLRFPKIGYPPIIPKLDHCSIATHDFGVPHSKNPRSMFINFKQHYVYRNYKSGNYNYTQ